MNYPTTLGIKQMARRWLVFSSLFLATGCSTTNQNKVAEGTSELPNVLIIGDSISIGYTPEVTEVLTGVASIHRPDENTRDTRFGLGNLDRWLGDTQWDVIHFNWGLHDLAYRHPDSTATGRRDKINGTISVSLDEYKLNLEKLVTRLKSTGATLIWASTTLVPDGEVGRVPGDDLRYNLAAAEVMKRHNIATDDLHMLTSGFDSSMFVGPGNVHYTEEGYAVVATQVARLIRAAFEGEGKTDSAFLEKTFSALAGDNAAPQVYEFERRQDELFELYLDGPPYKGSPTRFFGIYSLPDIPLESDRIEAGRVPAVVLIHGGGGSAYAEWVRRWNDAGFAAISIAVEGQTDVVADENLRGRERWTSHDLGGPPRTGIYQDFAEPVSNEWMFHSVYAAIQANNFLRNQNEIDPENIGVVGISWGGVITATTIGFDQRFSFAVPIYGSGHLAEIPNQYGSTLADNPEYSKQWEPALRLKQYTNPTLWLTGRAENNFSLPAQAASYGSVGGTVAVSIKPGMRHGHQAAWREPEPYAFAAAVVESGEPPFVPSEVVLTDNGSVAVSFRISKELVATSAVAYVTNEEVIDPETAWQEFPASVARVDDDLSTVEVLIQSIPRDSAHWFVNLSLRHEDSGQVLTASGRLSKPW
jgi:dienelactone hydrolase